MDKIEEVARAIAVARGMNPDALTVTADGGTPRDCKTWEILVPSAVAAIKAMRMPTPFMRDRGLRARHAFERIDECFTTMVDAAVEEHEIVKRGVGPNVGPYNNTGDAETVANKAP